MCFVHVFEYPEGQPTRQPSGLWGESGMELSVQRKGPQKGTQHIDFCQNWDDWDDMAGSLVYNLVDRKCQMNGKIRMFTYPHSQNKNAHDIQRCEWSQEKMPSIIRYRREHREMAEVGRHNLESKRNVVLESGNRTLASNKLI